MCVCVSTHVTPSAVYASAPHAAIPEPVTQTVISSDVGSAAVVGEDVGVDVGEGEKGGSYAQLLEAGLSSGGLQPTQIPQVTRPLAHWHVSHCCLRARIVLSPTGACCVFAKGHVLCCGT